MPAPARTSDSFDASSANAGVPRRITTSAARANTTDALYPGCMRFETARLVLRELEESDAPAMNVWESDPEVVRYQSSDVSTVAQSLTRIRRAMGGALEQPRRL